MEIHPKQRSVDKAFLSTLFTSLKNRSPRSIVPFSVVPKSALSSDLMDLLRSSSSPVPLPGDLTYFVIDGQHRLLALRKIREQNWDGGDSDFYEWPCKVYMPELAEKETIKAWMVSRNDPGEANPPRFVDKVLSLSEIKEERTRFDICKDICRSPKEAGIFKYLLTCPYWPELVKIAECALYRPLHWSAFKSMRASFSKEAHFYSLILRDVLDQHEALVKILEKHGDSSVGDILTEMDFFDLKKNFYPIQDDVVGAPVLLVKLRRIEDRGRPCASPSTLLNMLEKRSKDRDGFESGSPYVFGRMIPLAKDFDGEVFKGILNKCTSIMDRLQWFFPHEKNVKVKRRAPTNGLAAGKWDTWVSVIKELFDDKVQESDIEDVISHVIRNFSSLYLEEPVGPRPPDPHEFVSKLLKKNNDARKHWNELMDYCRNKGFSVVPNIDGLFFPDATNQVTEIQSVEELEDNDGSFEDEFDVENDENEAEGTKGIRKEEDTEYGYRNRTKAKDKQTTASKASRSSSRPTPSKSIAGKERLSNLGVAETTASNSSRHSRPTNVTKNAEDVQPNSKAGRSKRKHAGGPGIMRHASNNDKSGEYAGNTGDHFTADDNHPSKKRRFNSTVSSSEKALFTSTLQPTMRKSDGLPNVLNKSLGVLNKDLEVWEDTNLGPLDLRDEAFKDLYRGIFDEVETMREKRPQRALLLLRMVHNLMQEQNKE